LLDTRPRPSKAVEVPDGTELRPKKKITTINVSDTCLNEVDIEKGSIKILLIIASKH
jgi:hypothetical protein